MKPGRLKGIAAAPASKSEAHRVMICAGLSAGDTILDGFMLSQDMTATMNCLKSLGASFTLQGDRLIVHGSSDLISGCPEMDCGESGSTLRFFVPITMTRAEGGKFCLHGRLSRRPMDVYRELFVPRGALWQMEEQTEDTGTLFVKGILQPGEYEIPGDVSSQFVSGMLFALPMLNGDSKLTVLPPVESGDYIRMTLKAMADSGICIKEIAPWQWHIPGGQTYHSTSGRLNGDWSQGAVFICAAALGNDVVITGLDCDTTQGDKAVLDCLQKLGASVNIGPDGIRVSGSLTGTELDVRNCPDIAPILALVCQLSKGQSRIKGCGRLRLKECDRLEKTAEILNALGGSVEVIGEDMLINGVNSLKGGVTLDTGKDHRMVMLASIAALYCDKPVTVRNVEALAKSWPDYLELYHQLGGQTE